MAYRIKRYTQTQAKKLGVIVKPSKLKGKKIDVFKKGNKISSIGSLGYSDYATYIETRGIEYANKRRKLYKIRHNKTRNKIGTNSYYADKILW